MQRNSSDGSDGQKQQPPPPPTSSSSPCSSSSSSRNLNHAPPQHHLAQQPTTLDQFKRFRLYVQSQLLTTVPFFGHSSSSSSSVVRSLDDTQLVQILCAQNLALDACNGPADSLSDPSSSLLSCFSSQQSSSSIPLFSDAVKHAQLPTTDVLKRKSLEQAYSKMSTSWTMFKKTPFVRGQQPLHPQKEKPPTTVVQLPEPNTMKPFAGVGEQPWKEKPFVSVEQHPPREGRSFSRLKQLEQTEIPLVGVRQQHEKLLAGVDLQKQSANKKAFSVHNNKKPPWKRKARYIDYGRGNSGMKENDLAATEVYDRNDEPSIETDNFVSAADLLEEKQRKEQETHANSRNRILGGRIQQSNAKRKFVPVASAGMTTKRSRGNNTSPADDSRASTFSDVNGVPLDDPKLRNVEQSLIERILNEILENVPNVTWSDIAGLDHAKQTVMESVIWPILRPDIFRGLRGPPKGLLLFGPPGTGKTMIGKAIASESSSTFFNISASTLTSKWIGEGEKLVRSLFAVARCYSRSIIFIDEIDSLLTQRSETENEASRRIKTEFLVQIDGCGIADDDMIVVVGATNRPQELDEAARRRLVKRLYIPLPNADARIAIVRKLLHSVEHELNEDYFYRISALTEGYSGSDVRALCQDAALGPIRSLHESNLDIHNVSTENVRPLCFRDFENALTQIKPSVSDQDLALYVDWNKRYGSVSAHV